MRILCFPYMDAWWLEFPCLNGPFGFLTCLSGDESLNLRIPLLVLVLFSQGALSGPGVGNCL